MILIDDRVGSRELAPYIDRSVPRTLTRLDYGDASWIGNGPDLDGAAFIGVERKRLRDLLQSMESGRLANHQLVGMANAYHYSYVIIEGIWRAGRNGLIEIPRGKGRWEPLTLGSRSFITSTMDNFANTLSCTLGVMVVFTPTLARTALWMSNVYRWWTSKKWGQHRSCQGKVRCSGLPVPINGKKAPLVARVAMELKGVGVDRAMKIADSFGTMEALCGASVKELMGVDGVGKTVASGIVKEIKGE